MSKRHEIVQSLDEFAKYCHNFIRADNYMLAGTGGMPGKGKSTFMCKLQKSYAKISKTEWSFDRMTWDREELMRWIDGEREEKKGQLPVFSAVQADEMLHMFHNRNFSDTDQIEAIEVFNMCRDRHLFVGGNLPVFFQLDKQLRAIFNFYIYIPKRGVAWVFIPEENPFSDDPWNAKENMKIFRNNRGKPYNCSNYLCTVHFNDWEPEERAQYLQIRNTKRVKAIENKRVQRTESSHSRLKIIIGLFANKMIDKYEESVNSISKMIGLHHTTLMSYSNMAKANMEFLKENENNNKGME